MKIVGLITEYNPFHNGHAYHIQKAKEITGADFAVVVMSGNFVQRGTPAVMPKSIRTECALRSGADLVIELPVCYSTGSAEYFAMGAVSLLDNLGCVDFLCFGSECGDTIPLQLVADLLTGDPSEYRILLQGYLKSGDSFPRARQKALSKYLQTYADDRYSDYDFDAVLSNPNNILGIEYIKALNRLHSSITPCTIQRTGSGYHDTSLEHEFSSASAIRAEIHSMKKIERFVPEITVPILEREYQKTFPVTSNALSLLLKYRLLGETPDSLTEYVDVNEDLANRIYNNLNLFSDFEQFCDVLKTKELTRARISRALLHIILCIKKADLDSYMENGVTFYIHLSGFRKKSSELLRIIKERADIPVLSTYAEKRSINSYGKTMLESDIIASNLYYSIITDQFGTPFKNELSRKITIL